MNITNKKLLTICISIILSSVTIATVAIIFKPTNIDRFLNYDETKYKYTSFDTTVYNNGVIMNTMIRTYRKIDDSIEEDYLKKESAKIENVDDYINDIKELNKISKDNIILMKNIKNLSVVDYTDTSDFDAVIDIWIQDDKLFDKNSWNYYMAELKVYLKDEIIELEDLGTKGKDNGGSTIYYKMDKSTLDLVNKILYDAKNQVLD